VAAGIAAVLVIVAGVWKTMSPDVQAEDAAVIAQKDPEFYRWYFEQPVLQVANDDSPERGPADAAITLVEFSDFECGHCAAFDRTVERVLRGRSDIRVIFRHFPLDAACNPSVSQSLHPDACLAAVAAECAAQQGKFWQYGRLLFENQDHLGRQFLIGYADRVGLDEQSFTACLGDERMRARIVRDTRAGTALGIESTPTFFINGRRIRGALEKHRLAQALALACAESER
jgi:protein-disulfide isomerase